MKFFLAFATGALLSGSVLMLEAEECGGITFKRERLPKECVRKSICGPRTIFIPRSQGSNTALDISGWKHYLPRCDYRAWGSVGLAVEYKHSFKGKRLAHYLFGSTQLKFSGSKAAERGERDLLADNFGLPTDFVGAISFKPSIENIVLNLDYHLGLDAWCDGLYFKVKAPIVTTRWDLGIGCNEMNNIGRQDAPVFPACYMAEEAVPTARSIRQALSGTLNFGDMAQPLMFGVLPCGREQKTGVSNLDVIVGWNGIADECSHAGIYLLTVIPTGNRPHSDILFEPIVGNGNLWEIGPGFSGHLDFYRSDCHTCSLYVEGVLTHQFKRFQIRSFDLVGHGPFSRYMLLKEFRVDDKGNRLYDEALFNAIDFATRAVRVGGSVRFDASAKLSYRNNCWGFDLGYNIYARTKEKLRIQDDLFPSDLNNRPLGIKGTEGVCYRILKNGELDSVAPLHSTQNGSTSQQGAPVDNPRAVMPPLGRTVATWDDKQPFQSDPPIILATDILDITSGAVPRQLTHKFFAHVGYTAHDCAWEPQFGVGGEVEFDGHSSLLSSLNQWGIWFKGAVAF